MPVRFLLGHCFHTFELSFALTSDCTLHMNLAVDYGNSRIKVGIFQKSELIDHEIFHHESSFNNWLQTRSFTHVIVSSVTRSVDDILNSIKAEGVKLAMSQSLPLPINNKYKSSTLGLDRIAAACGAIEIMPKQDCLVIDLGTCINYEFIDSTTSYLGGAISPGISMRFKAMHTFTAKLPLVNPMDIGLLTGSTTDECMQSGVMIGVLSELEGVISRYKEKYPNMGVILCGGDAHFFENKLKQPIFVAPNLVLRGLNRILVHNVSF